MLGISRYLAIAVLLVCQDASLAADGTAPEIKSPAVRKAMETYQTTIARAEETFRKSVVRAEEAFHKSIAPAQKRLLDELERAERTATKRGDLDEATEIRSQRTTVEKAIPTGLIGDPAARTRELLEGTRWTLERGSDKTTLSFQPGNVLTHVNRAQERKQMASAMLDGKTAVYAGDVHRNITVITFNESLTEYKIVAAHEAVKTHFTGGKRVQ